LTAWYFGYSKVDWFFSKAKRKLVAKSIFAKYFNKFKPLRSLDEIRREILILGKETDGTIRKVLT
jgi:type I restriction enzyme M protein